jgi:general secretion pathway protein B
MSFILDALKKSEIERQRQSVPGLMDAGPAPRRARFPAWAIALTALLAVNLAVLIVVLARGGFSSSPKPRGSEPPAVVSGAAVPAASIPAAPAAAAAPGAAPSASAARTAAAAASDAAPSPGAAQASGDSSHFSPMDAAPPVYAPEIPADNGPAPAAVSASGPVKAPPGSSAARGRDPLLTAGADKSDQEVLPTLSELDLTGANALPELHLDVHVYAANPSERFVYVNMRKYREGATLAEGPVLERIRRDGVVLDYRGQRFLLPRQQ